MNRFVITDENSFELRDADGNIINIEDRKRVRPNNNNIAFNYNKDHDPATGRFSSGGGGSKKSKKYKVFTADVSYLEQFFDYKKPDTGKDISRAPFTEMILEKEGMLKKPRKLDKFTEGSKIIYRGWDDEKHIDSFVEDKVPRMSWGISGNGLYFSTNKKEAKSYAENGIVTTMAISKKARGIEIIDLAMKSSADKKKTDSQIMKLKKVAEKNNNKEEIKRLNKLLKISSSVYHDYGTYAAINGYDYITVTKQTGQHIVLLNRGMLEI